MRFGVYIYIHKQTKIIEKYQQFQMNLQSLTL